MVKYRLTKITPDYDEPGVFDLTTQEFRSINVLTTHASDLFRRCISFQICQVTNGKCEEICSYNFFDVNGLTFTESCPELIKFAIKLTESREVSE